MGECRGAVKLYSDFLQSDIVVASPIALATKLSDEQKEEEGGPADFLSSIEIAVADRADVLLMQNWAHVVTGWLPPAHGRQWPSTLCGSCQSAKTCCCAKRGPPCLAIPLMNSSSLFPVTLQLQQQKHVLCIPCSLLESVKLVCLMRVLGPTTSTPCMARGLSGAKQATLCQGRTPLCYPNGETSVTSWLMQQGASCVLSTINPVHRPLKPVR